MDGLNRQSWSLAPVEPSVFHNQLARDNLTGALEAFSSLLKRPADRTYKTGLLGIEDTSLLALAKEAQSETARRDPKDFFSSNFTPFEIKADEAGSTDGLLTGFYEPEAEASPTRTEHFSVPLYAWPDDLVELKTDEKHPGLPAGSRFGRQTADQVVTYHDRQAIETGALAGRGLEIAWLRDPVTAFFIHIQGAALLHMTDGSRMRVTYAAKSGHPFTGIGGLLVKAGEVDAAAISMQTIKAWLADHRNRAQALMWRNRSFIFFRKTDVYDEDPGPIGAAKVPLSPLRSIAVDRTIHTFGTPFFIQSDNINGAQFKRLLIAQDTGSAIVGPARADIFFGTGEVAGELAGGVKSRGNFIVLVPNTAVSSVLERAGAHAA